MSPLAKLPVDLHDADGQQAAAFPLDGLLGPGVQEQPAARLDGKADPAFPGGHGLALGQEQRADDLAGDDLRQDVGRRGRWR